MVSIIGLAPIEQRGVLPFLPKKSELFLICLPAKLTESQWKLTPFRHFFKSWIIFATIPSTDFPQIPSLDPTTAFELDYLCFLSLSIKSLFPRHWRHSSCFDCRLLALTRTTSLWPPPMVFVCLSKILN
jgi:hypothetical protein